MDMEKLWEKKKEQMINMPIIESNIFKSKDGSFIIHKTTITDIKSIKYYDAVMESNSSLKEEKVA